MRYAFASLEGPDGELSATEIQTEQFPGIMFAPVAPIAHDGKIYVIGAVGGGRLHHLRHGLRRLHPPDRLASRWP